jgi:hypothetical protein
MRGRWYGVVALIVWLMGGSWVEAATYVTLRWEPPVSFPSLGGGERVIYTLWRRGASQSSYRRVRNIPIGTRTFRVTLPQGSGYICYRISVLQVPIGGSAVIDASTFAEVQGHAGCLAICLAGTTPLRSLDADECAITP